MKDGSYGLPNGLHVGEVEADGLHGVQHHLIVCLVVDGRHLKIKHTTGKLTHPKYSSLHITGDIKIIFTMQNHLKATIGFDEEGIGKFPQN